MTAHGRIPFGLVGIVRTTVTIDDDVAALLAAEQARTGETFRETLNRLLRRSVRGEVVADPFPPLLRGRPIIDITDVSTVVAELDEARPASRFG